MVNYEKLIQRPSEKCRLILQAKLKDKKSQTQSYQVMWKSFSEEADVDERDKALESFVSGY
jgi:hypothetical protein